MNATDLDIVDQKDALKRQYDTVRIKLHGYCSGTRNENSSIRINIVCLVSIFSMKISLRYYFWAWPELPRLVSMKFMISVAFLKACLLF